MKINCISCGFTIHLDDAYEDYEGQIKCFTCQALLDVKIEEDKLKSVKLVKYSERPAA